MVILVTGATSGFGKSAASMLAREGHTVYGTGRSAIDGTVSDGVRMVRMDVSDRISVETAVSRILEEAGRIDVLVNNAGMGICGAAELATESEISMQMNTNFLGTVNLCSAVLPSMRMARKGLVINMSSIAGIFAIPYQGFYSASKAAVESYSEALDLEMRRFGIRVCIVEPGDFRTSFTSSRKISALTDCSEDYSESFRKTLAGIEKDELSGGSPDQVAKAICRLVGHRNPPFRTLVGSALQTTFARVSHILPRCVMRRLLCMFYSIPSR